MVDDTELIINHNLVNLHEQNAREVDVSLQSHILSKNSFTPEPKSDPESKPNTQDDTSSTRPATSASLTNITTTKAPSKFKTEDYPLPTKAVGDMSPPPPPPTELTMEDLQDDADQSSESENPEKADEFPPTESPSAINNNETPSIEPKEVANNV